MRGCSALYKISIFNGGVSIRLIMMGSIFCPHFKHRRNHFSSLSYCLQELFSNEQICKLFYHLKIHVVVTVSVNGPPVWWTINMRNDLETTSVVLWDKRRSCIHTIPTKNITIDYMIPIYRSLCVPNVTTD